MCLSRTEDILTRSHATRVVEHPCAHRSEVEMKEDFEGYTITSPVRHTKRSSNLPYYHSQKGTWTRSNIYLKIRNRISPQGPFSNRSGSSEHMTWSLSADTVRHGIFLWSRINFDLQNWHWIVSGHVSTYTAVYTGHISKIVTTLVQSWLYFSCIFKNEIHFLSDTDRNRNTCFLVSHVCLEPWNKNFLACMKQFYFTGNHSIMQKMMC